MYILFDHAVSNQNLTNVSLFKRLSSEAAAAPAPAGDAGEEQAEDSNWTGRVVQTLFSPVLKFFGGAGEW